MARLGQVYTSLSSNGTAAGCSNVSIRLYQTGSQKRVTSVMGNLIQGRSKSRDLESGVLCHHDSDFRYSGSSRHEQDTRCACIQHSTSSSTRFPFNSHLVAPSFSHQHPSHCGHDSLDIPSNNKYRRNNKTNLDNFDQHSHYHCCGVRSVPLTILERQTSPFAGLGSSSSPHFDGFVRKHSKTNGFSDQRRYFSSSGAMAAEKRGWDVLWQSLANKVSFHSAFLQMM